MDISAIQKRCLALGHSPGQIDGRLGPRTYAALFSAVARRTLGERGLELGKGAAKHFPEYEITTALRLAHFLAQTAHESMGYFYMEELGGQSYFRMNYDVEGKKPHLAYKLGNSIPGDGYRYKGRGILQLTGRYNYRAVGSRIGVDLENHPDRAARPDVSVHIACDYWRDRDINRLADRDDVVAVTKKVNGGTNGLADRKKYLARAKAILLGDA